MGRNWLKTWLIWGIFPIFLRGFWTKLEAALIHPRLKSCIYWGLSCHLFTIGSHAFCVDYSIQMVGRCTVCKHTSKWCTVCVNVKSLQDIQSKQKRFKKRWNLTFLSGIKVQPHLVFSPNHYIEMRDAHVCSLTALLCFKSLLFAPGSCCLRQASPALPKQLQILQTSPLWAETNTQCCKHPAVAKPRDVTIGSTLDLENATCSCKVQNSSCMLLLPADPPAVKPIIVGVRNHTSPILTQVRATGAGKGMRIASGKQITICTSCNICWWSIAWHHSCCDAVKLQCF